LGKTIALRFEIVRFLKKTSALRFENVKFQTNFAQPWSRLCILTTVLDLDNAFS
jgi:hypothetical protein